MVMILSVPVALTFLRYRDMLAEMQMRGGMDSLGQVVAMEAVNWYSWILVIPLIDWTIRRTRAISTPAKLRAAATHVALLAAFSLFHGIAMYATARAIRSMERAPLSRTLKGQTIPMVLLYSAALVVVALAQWRVAVVPQDQRLATCGAVILAANLGTAAMIFSFTPFVAQMGIQYWFLAGALHGVAVRNGIDGA